MYRLGVGGTPNLEDVMIMLEILLFVRLWD
jgi:hypothetical protein